MDYWARGLNTGCSKYEQVTNIMWDRTDVFLTVNVMRESPRWIQACGFTHTVKKCALFCFLVGTWRKGSLSWVSVCKKAGMREVLQYLSKRLDKTVSEGKSRHSELRRRAHAAQHPSFFYFESACALFDFLSSHSQFLSECNSSLSRVSPCKYENEKRRVWNPASVTLREHEN